MVNLRKIEQQALRSHAQFYQQGGRDAYALVMDLATLDSILPTPPPEASTRIVGNNRRFHMPHARTIAEYLYRETDWVLGSILLGIEPRYVQFDPYEEGGEPSKSLGEFRIPLVGGFSSIEILDGQHRRMAIRLVLRRLEDENRALEESSKNAKSANGKRQAELRNRLESLKRMSIPVTVYAEPDVRNRARMFADLAQTRNIAPITKARFNDRDPFNRAAMELVELSRSELLANKVEMERSTPLLSSDKLLSLNQLSRCLSILRYGFGSRISRSRFSEAQRDYDDIVDAGIAWADEFLPSARAEYEALRSIELEDDYVAVHRAQYLAYSVTMLQILAGCFFEWNKHHRPFSELANWLREADFDRDSENCLFLKTGALVPGDTSLTGRRPSTRNTINFIVENALKASH